MATTNNPYDICTWRPASACADCSLAGKLKCRFDWGDLGHFMATFAGFAIPAVIGVVRGSYGWYLLGWAAFLMIFFQLWEIRILCSHCPYYAEKGRTLHCIANYGSFKAWKYHPEPISKAETVQLVVGFTILGGYPFPFMLLGGQFAWALVAAWGLFLFFWTLRKYTCSQCVNFSCFMNTVPQEVVDVYLERNPTMKKAWEE
ncbi:MAG: hypothetical protein DRJ03_18715 [Chloroflexi bacterium]|nr:MAG: hypothetical protein DRJ03_18715 [Chloroflexota bacterium]